MIFDEAHQLEDVATDYFGVGRVVAAADGAGARPERARSPRATRPTSWRRPTRTSICAPISCSRRCAGGCGGKGERAAVDGATWAGEPERSAHALDVALEEVEGALGAVDGGALSDGGNEAGALKRRARAIRDDLALLVDGAQK